MNDSEIIQLYYDRNETAIETTAQKYGNYCTAIAQNILGSREDAEECVNDTYLKAWNSIPPNHPENLATYLGKITRNLSFDKYKKNRANKRGGGELPVVLEELKDCVSGISSVEDEINSKELAKAIDDFLDSLTADKKIIFIKRYWYTESVMNIARQQGLKAGTVSMTLTRLRAKLHDYLLERGFEV